MTSWAARDFELYRRVRAVIRSDPSLTTLAEPVGRTVRKVLKRRALDRHFKTRLSGSEASAQIASRIERRLPSAIGKLGATECEALHYALLQGDLSAELPKALGQELFTNSGVFPKTCTETELFFREYGRSLTDLDMLSVWGTKGEDQVVSAICPDVQTMALAALDPLQLTAPWTSALRGKRLLVVHPFEKTVTKQYARRKEIWPKDHESFLPELELNVLRVPLSAAIAPPNYASWSETFKALRSAMEQIDFDVALIGAGGYSLPLAAFAKSIDRIGIHLGGGTQVLFGIRGRRFDAMKSVTAHYNDAWVRPAESETPQEKNLVEWGCYW